MMRNFVVTAAVLGLALVMQSPLAAKAPGEGKGGEHKGAEHKGGEHKGGESRTGGNGAGTNGAGANGAGANGTGTNGAGENRDRFKQFDTDGDGKLSPS